MKPQSDFEYVRHAQSPFFRLPLVDVDSAAAYDRADVVLLGVPYDGGTTYRPGTRFGPYGIRPASAAVQAYHPVHGFDVFERLRTVDGGNVPVSPFDSHAARDAIEAAVRRVATAGAVPMIAGGDHSLTWPALRALAAAHGPLAVVHVDAHLDTMGAEIWANDDHHGTPFRHAIEEALLAPGQLYQVGMRGSFVPGEDALGARFGARRFLMHTVAEQGVPAVARQIREAIGARPTYLSFDIDAVDPGSAPGTGAPVPGGLSAREALTLVRELAGVKLVGMDVVEVTPAFDHAEITCTLAAYLLFEGLALVALRPA